MSEKIYQETREAVSLLRRLNGLPESTPSEEPPSVELKAFRRPPRQVASETPSACAPPSGVSLEYRRFGVRTETVAEFFRRLVK